MGLELVTPHTRPASGRFPGAADAPPGGRGFPSACQAGCWRPAPLCTARSARRQLAPWARTSAVCTGSSQGPETAELPVAGLRVQMMFPEPGRTSASQSPEPEPTSPTLSPARLCPDMTSCLKLRIDYCLIKCPKRAEIIWI